MAGDVACLGFHYLIVVSIRKMVSDFPFGDAPAKVEFCLGLNSGTGREVVVDKLTCRRLLRVSAFYADAPYAADKPYIFTVDGEGCERYAAW